MSYQQNPDLLSNPHKECVPGRIIVSGGKDKILKFMPYFAARVVEKNLVAAIANANEKFGANAEDLKISEIYADESKTYRRGKPRAQGRIYRRLKRTSHLTVKLASSKN